VANVRANGRPAERPTGLVDFRPAVSSVLIGSFLVGRQISRGPVIRARSTVIGNATFTGDSIHETFVPPWPTSWRAKSRPSDRRLPAKFVSDYILPSVMPQRRTTSEIGPFVYDGPMIRYDDCRPLRAAVEHVEGISNETGRTANSSAE